MSIPSSVKEILLKVQAIHERFATLVAQTTDQQLEAAILADGRSGKDVLAHLAFWDNRLLHAVAPQGGAAVSRLAPPLIADIPYDEQWLELVNDRIFRLNQARGTAEVREEFLHTGARLRHVVSTLSDHDVFDPQGISALLGEPFAPMVIGAYEHYEEHLEDLLAVANHQ